MTEFVMPIMEDVPRGQPRPVYTWEPTAAHRARALSNHDQTLERLRERGGVCWTELYCILADRKLFSIEHNASNTVIAKRWALKTFPQP